MSYISPSTLLGAALFSAFFYQVNIEAISGLWVLFVGLACFLALYKAPASEYQSTPVSNILILWFAYVTGYCFIYKPLLGTGLAWFIICLPVFIYFATQRHNLNFKPVFVVLAFFALLCVIQYVCGAKIVPYYSGYNWPILNPNNFSCLMVVGSIAAFNYWMAKPKALRIIPMLLFVAALAISGSTAGFMALAVAVAVVAACCIPKYRLLIISFMIAGLVSGLILNIDSFVARLPIWSATIEMIKAHPYGVGLGNFASAYKLFRTESYTSGFYAHNDFLQLAAEMGAANILIILTALLVAIIKTTSYKNCLEAAIMSAIFIQAMVEFQFYFPASMLLFSIVLVYHQKKHYQHEEIKWENLKDYYYS